MEELGWRLLDIICVLFLLPNYEICSSLDLRLDPLGATNGTCKELLGDSVWRSCMLECKARHFMVCYLSLFKALVARRYEDSSERFLFCSICSQVMRG